MSILGFGYSYRTTTPSCPITNSTLCLLSAGAVPLSSLLVFLSGLLPLRRGPGTALCRLRLRARGGCCGRRHGYFRYKRVVVNDGNLYGCELVDVADVGALFGIAERECDAVGACPACAPDAVDVGFGDVGNLVVDDVRELLHIYTSGGNIGGYEDAGGARFEIAQRALTGVLRLVAVYGFGLDACANEVFGHAICAVFGAREDERGGNVVLANEVQEQRALVVFLYIKERLVNGLGGGGGRRDGYFLRLGEDGVGQLHDFGRHGRREEERLAAGRELGNDLAHVVDEAHVEHAVGFIEDENFDVGQGDEALLHEVEQAAGRGYEDVNAFSQRVGLCFLRYAAEDDGVAQAGVTAVGGNAFVNLYGQLAGGREDEATNGFCIAYGAGALVEQLQNGHRKSSGFAGAGLRAAQEVALLQYDGYGLFLDGGGLGVSFFAGCVEERGNQIQLFKIHV